ncbi:bacteriocin [Staphylococcus hominis]|uniref:bacteriocin n=1 Tax=Staphylococcus hominis TaxID=1290 RepID=UPI000AF5A938|nr:bacteriocin [Staphylococcus hominis]MDS3909632.1 bacteriocin [Staphylococcus hominis]
MKLLDKKELKQVNGGMWTAEETGRKTGNVARQGFHLVQQGAEVLGNVGSVVVKAK